MITEEIVKELGFGDEISFEEDIEYQYLLKETKNLIFIHFNQGKYQSTRLIFNDSEEQLNITTVDELRQFCSIMKIKK